MVHPGRRRVAQTRHCSVHGHAQYLTQTRVGEERYERSEFQQKVRAMFKCIEELESTRWFNVDADESREKVEQQIRDIVTPRLTMELGPLNYNDFSEYARISF